MLSDFRKRKFTALFHHLDIDDDGVISNKDFVRYAEIMKTERGWADDEPGLAALIAATGAWWTDMLARVAPPGAQVITFQQWLRFHELLGQEILTNGAPPQWAVDMCITTHKLLDLDGNGTVNCQEYSLWLRCIGSNADPQQVFARLDLNGDGVVDLSEMMQLFGQFVLSEDPADPGNYLMTGTF